VESGFVVRPAGQTSASAGRKPAVRDAVPASLSTARSVTAARKSAEVRAEDNFHAGQIVLDAQSHEVIREALDTARRLVRPPEEARRRLRAYARGRAASRENSKDHFDLEA
jgi:hypothetical protein